MSDIEEQVLREEQRSELFASFVIFCAVAFVFFFYTVTFFCSALLHSLNESVYVFPDSLTPIIISFHNQPVYTMMSMTNNDFFFLCLISTP